ncbi:hypothetical protein BMB58_004053 [Shigella sonnei]|nr:hypothetical protein [Shigella sonnei]
MRLEVFCEDRLGLTRELLDLLVLRGIDLRGIEIDPIGRIYLNFAELEFESFSSLMDEITSRFERSVLTQLYRNYPSTRKLAKRLGVSHTAIANKLREYGLSQKKNEE